MLTGLIGLLVAIIVIAIVAAILIYAIDMLPIDARLNNLLRVLVLVIAALAIILKALPLLGVAV